MLTAEQIFRSEQDSVVETTTDQLMLAKRDVLDAILQGHLLPRYTELGRQPNPNPDEPDYRAADVEIPNREILHATAFYDRGHVRVNVYATLGRRRAQRGGRDVFTVRSIPLASRCTTVPDKATRDQIETLQRRCYEDVVRRAEDRLAGAPSAN